MKDKEKRRIVILVGITIVVIIIVMLTNKNKKDEKAKNEVVEENSTIVLEDETILNESKKLKENKKFEGMEISNIQLTETEEETVLITTVTNTSQTKQGGYPVKIKMIDEHGKEIKNMAAYIGEIQPGKSIKMSTSAIFDSRNVYDFIITKE